MILHIFYFMLVVIFKLCLQSEGSQMAKHLEIIVDHVFSLDCNPEHKENVTVSWSQDHNQSLLSKKLPAGIRLINQSLWFFPAQPSHSGIYTCVIKDNHGSSEEMFSISVAYKTCPQLTPKRYEFYVKKGFTSSINCDLDHMKRILQLDPHSQVSWRKDCSPLNKNGLLLRLNSISESDSGVYTCVANFTHAGRGYTAAKTIEVFVTEPDSVSQKPFMLNPRSETRIVKLGESYELNCRVLIQKEDFIETYGYWIVNDFYPDYFNVSIPKFEVEGNAGYWQLNLSISEVRAEFLHIPFTCQVYNSKGTDNGTVVLLLASKSELYGGLAFLAGFTVLALGLLTFCLFKVDLVLAYRDFSPCLQRQNDGKLFDAYVSYPHGNDDSTSTATAFTLHILPKVLEDELGYRLFISGRDELPGEAVHDVIEEMVGRSRRLIIVLTPQSFRKPTDSTVIGLLHGSAEPNILSSNVRAIYPDLSDLRGTQSLNWGPYECWVGVYDALVKGGLQVILIQVEGEVDEALLPESLRYIKRTQGMLRWKQTYGTNPNGRFWKQMRYHMPPVQKAKLDTLL